MEPYRVIITTCDKYLPALKPMAHLMNKYWQPCPGVLVGGFTPPTFSLPDNWAFHSIGSMNDFPVNKWSDGVIKLLENIDDEVVLLMLDDMWPIRTVDTIALDILYRYMLQFRYVAKMDVCGDRLYAYGVNKNYGTVNRLDLIKSMPGSPYHLSLMPGFWRREHLLNVLVPGETPWEVEINGTTRLSHNQDVIVLGTQQWPLRITLAFRGGDSDQVITTELGLSDIEEMRETGLLEVKQQ